MKYSLRQMEVFLAVAHFENLTKAAASLSMSQSAASSALKELEQQFDIQLFDRVGKRLQLNGTGKTLRPKAISLMAQATELQAELAEDSRFGKISIGASLTIGNYLGVRIIAQFMNEHPEAEVTMNVENTAHIADKVANFELDVGLVEGEIQHPDLEVIPWREDSLVVFASPKHPLCKKSKITDKDILSVPWVLREPGSGTRQTFDRAMKGLSHEINVFLELQHTEAIKRAVEENLGLGCLSEVALKDAFKTGRLTKIPVNNKNFKHTYYFVMHKQKYRSMGVEKFLDYCRQWK